MSQQVYIDVGCRAGIYALKWAEDRNKTVYAFEPEPVAYAELCKLAPPNMKVFPWAVCTRPGTFPFFVSSNPGASSLKPTVPGKCPYTVTSTVDVRTVRLDWFLADHGISKIECLKVDAQGSDLDVIESLGDRVRGVRCILIEAAKDGTEYYEGQCHASEVTAYLVRFGFKLTGTRPDGNFLDLAFLNTYRGATWP